MPDRPAQSGAAQPESAQPESTQLESARLGSTQPGPGRPRQGQPWSTQPWSVGAEGLWFGGDYNPEQWPAEILAQDDELMRRARVNAATIGVFSWSCLEPEEGRYEFGWLDDTMDRLHANGVRAVLATPTASPPPWFTFAHPDAMPVTADGVRLWHGSRDTYCAAAPAYRAAALRIATAMAERYAGHPALALWHVHNEYGPRCWCDHAAAAFRRWLQTRYGTGETGLAALNESWHTAFWSQRYGDWDQVLPTRATEYLHNPAQRLDFHRFWSDELLAAYVEQRDVLRAHSPQIPITTNFCLPSTYQHLDFWRWSAQVDVVSVDIYPGSTGPDAEAELAFGADRARSFNAGRPWILMEQSTSLMYQYQQGVFSTKAAGRMLLQSLEYLARGSDTALFFQWRAGRGGAEVHHSSMVPHAGPDTRLFREIVELGDLVQRLGEVAGSTVPADVAIVWDADGWWSLDTPSFPSSRLQYVETVREVHTALRAAGVVTDFVHPEAVLAGYRLVLMPSAYLLSHQAISNLEKFVADGGVLLVGCFSGVVDEHSLVRLGGFPGGLLETLGCRVEEFHPLPDDVTVGLSDGGSGRLWSEHVRVGTAEVISSYHGGVLDGLPAVTRHRHGQGTAWYLSTRPDEKTLTGLVQRWLGDARVGPVIPGLPADVVAVRRVHPDGRSWLFVLNHGRTSLDVPIAGADVLTGADVGPTLRLAPHGFAVVRE